MDTSQLPQVVERISDSVQVAHFAYQLVALIERTIRALIIAHGSGLHPHAHQGPAQPGLVSYSSEDTDAPVQVRHAQLAVTQQRNCYTQPLQRSGNAHLV